MSEIAVVAKPTQVRIEAVRTVLFALAYFVGGELGYALSLGPSVGGTFWPPAGIALAVFLASPRRAWPQLVAAGVLANYASDLLHGQTLAASIGFALANLTEPVIGAYLLGRLFAPGRITFTRLTDIVAMALVVTFVSAPISSTIGALAAELWTENPPGFAASWRTWWIGDTVGALVLTPCIFRIMAGWRRIGAVPARVWAETAAFGAVLLVVTEIVFSAPPTSLAAPFLVFPVLLWGSVRLGPIGVGAALCLVVVLTAHGTANGAGPFAAEHLSLGDRLVALQIYIGVMAVSFHGLSVLWEERSRTAAALRLAHSGLEARYRRIVEQSPLAILAVERDGRVREVNPAWRRLWPPSSAHEAPSGNRPWDDSRLKPMLDRAFSGEVVELPERELLVPAGAKLTHRRVRGFAYPVKDEAGNVAEVVLIERDITEELEAQERLVNANRALREREEALSNVLAQMAEAQRQREQLLDAERFARGEAERASRLKDEFLATLSHELRTPLNAIIGWAHILRHSADAGTRSQAVETIERNARAQARIIEDLLDMSRIMAGKVGLAIANVNLAGIVTAAGDALRPVADAKGVELSIAVDDQSAISVSGDAARLQQVVTNLLDNGVKFTPPGGRVDARIAVRAREAQIIVRDTGQGISPEFLPSVFERFRQADASTTRRHVGLGLGLSIAKQIVEIHGGSIAADSAGPDRGATFTVTLPLAESAVESQAPAEAFVSSLELAGRRVLVIDDERDARELLRRLLVDQGCEVETAGSSKEALTKATEDRYDVLLTDIGMPDADGYDLLRQVRAGDFGEPKMIAVTAFARSEDRDRALAAGFDAHIAKPVDPVRLVRTMAEVLPAAR